MSNDCLGDDTPPRQRHVEGGDCRKEPEEEEGEYGEDYDLCLYAKSLLDLGEYERAAHCLSEREGDWDGLSCYGVFIRAYALYLAGERRKEEEIVELRQPLERSSITNKNLGKLSQELLSQYKQKKLSSFGLYIFGVVLKNLQKQQQQYASPPHTPQSILIQSILSYPYNWSAWLDLSELCVENPSIHSEVERLLQPLSHHWMYYFFLIQIFIEQQQNDQAILLIQRLATPSLFPNSTSLKATTAVAHYNLRDFDTAQSHFSQLVAADPHRLEQMDIYSNILYVQESKPELSHLAHSAVRIDKYRPETCCVVGNYYSLKGQHEKAVQYFQRALKLDREYLSAWTLMGHEFVEMKNTAAAIEAYRRAVDINPRDYRAWYGLGQTYEILNMLLYALFYYRKATSLRPYDARMWCAVGGCFLGLERREDAKRSFERAVSNRDREGIATMKLAALYREEGDEEKAARCYKRHLDLKLGQQLQTTSSSSVAFMTLEGKDQGAAGMDSIMNLVQVDAPEAEALLYLAFYHRDNGNYETSAKCCSRLLEYPGPEKEEAKALLREIRSRMDREEGNRSASSRYDPRVSDMGTDAGDLSFQFSP